MNSFLIIYWLSVIFLFGESYGKGGWKGGHSQREPYDSVLFRISVFSPETSNVYFTKNETTNSYVISHPATPIIYDSHHFYWDGYYHRRNETENVCQYHITLEDGDLYRVQFENGTSPKYIFFECGEQEACCGLGCCYSASALDTVVSTLCFLFITAVVVLIFHLAKKAFYMLEYNWRTK